MKILPFPFVQELSEEWGRGTAKEPGISKKKEEKGKKREEVKTGGKPNRFSPQVGIDAIWRL